MPAIFACGAYDDGARALLGTACNEAGASLHLARTVEEAESALGALSPRALVVQGTGGLAARVALLARAHADLRHLPILATAEPVDDLAFREALGWGADDVLDLSSERALLCRLRAVLGSPSPAPAPRRGRALIAEADRARRVALARVLDSAGFEVSFALSEEEVRAALADRRLAIVALSTSVVPAARALVDEARKRGCLARVLVSLRGAEQLRLGAEFAGVDGVRLLDAGSPPENALYVVNEMAMPDLFDKRKAPRELYGAIVQLRAEGHDFDETAFTYNVSTHGMYVRTLVAPPAEILWLELSPPRAPRRVRLVGQVAWRRPFGPGGHATVPPGFGLKIIDGAARDVELWQEGCAGLPHAVPALSSKPTAP
jgi:DNA-binding response OmpR family regulator